MALKLRADRHPWERQEPQESEVWYQRFLVYRDLGPEADRLRQCCEILNTTGDTIAYNDLKKAVAEFRWAGRAAAYDRYLARADLARMVKLRREAIDEQRKIARRLRLQAIQGLDTLDVGKLSPADIARFVDLSFKIERSIYEEVTDTAQRADASVTETTDIEALSPAERRRRLETLRDELASRASRAADDDEVVA